ncbi:hypothetical protein MNBD_GAMMA21-1387 [hydrothermal vent metagenome]|uniref:Uncharacterized protein n=1 Tax=hydrothermal vent metagenome TaxID=652676 RepID=A0A3B1AZL1_9ZZZZ
MISFLYRLVNSYETEHGFRPNMLYINPSHFEQLRVDLACINGLDNLVQFLGMEIAIDADMAHPQVAFTDINWRHSQAV